jgi:glycosyltransferase involved in cell wall biosynthesis
MRIRFLNNYTLARDRCARGVLPRHHLWATDYLEARGHQLCSGRADVVYVANEQQARLHAVARRARLSPPLVVVFHHPRHNRRSGLWIRGIDTCICLSEHTRQVVERLGGRAIRAWWGPDLSYDYTPISSEYVVSVGKTARDHRTLLAALDVPAVVYLREPMPHHPAVTTRIIGPAGHFDYSRVIEDLKRASVVAIPLAGPGLVGLTELIDALALGKPVVMTRNPHFAPEEVGCGLSVAPGDVAGWRKAIASVTPEMGRRGRAFAEANDYQAFCVKVAGVIESLGRR